MLTTENLNNQITGFWTWFARHERELYNIEWHTDSILNDLLQRLQMIHSNIYCEICSDSSPRELIITAQGRKDLFHLVDAIIQAAPQLADWTFVSLKPPMGFDFQTTYEDVVLDPSAMWFLPLENAADPSALGLRVGIPNFDLRRERELENAVLVLLDTALGERAAATDLTHIEIAPLPSGPEDHGYIELSELPDFIRWRKVPDDN